MHSDLTPAVRQSSFVDQVTTGIAAKIESGEYALGTMLPSVRLLSDGWQVSRTVLREALARLSANGLIVSKQGLGFFVTARLPPRKLELSPSAEGEQLARIIELRMAMETEAAALAAERRTAKHLITMRQSLKIMAKGGANGALAASIEADLKFHETIYAATRNSHFQTLFSALKDVMHQNISVSRRNSAGQVDLRNQSQVEHKAIFAAIRDREARRAREAARTHVTNTARRLGLAPEQRAHRRSK